MRQAIATPSARAEIRAWPLDPSIRHVVILDVSMVPTDDQIDEWLTTAYSPATAGVPPADALRTGALYPAAAHRFLDHGFHVVDRLALLERPLLGGTAAHHDASPARRSQPVRLRRGRRRDLPTLASIDQAAFPTGWRNDAVSLGAITSATPQAHVRFATDARRRAIGFAITGKAGTTGYLQRIAVRPDAQRDGVGTRLVDDALHWLMRRGASRALVNTGVDNAAALWMYRNAGFDVLPDELVVLEHRRVA